jgi:phosphate transport system permease protein
VTTRADQPTAPPGVLIPPSSSSTGTATTGPPTSDAFGTPPRPPQPRRLPTPIRPRDLGWKDVGLLAAAAISSLCLVWVIFFQLTDLSGALGFLVCWYAAFLGLTWLVTAQVVEPQAATDRVVAVVVVTAAALIIGIVLFIVVWVAYKAVPTIHWGSLFSKDARDLSATNPNTLNQSGVLHAIIGTLEQVALSAAIGVPIAIATAIFLNEVGGRGTRLIRTVVTAMSGTPSIVAGVFIYSVFIINHWLSFSGLAASLALVVILLPSVTRVIEEVLRVVPSGLREASMALGAPQWRTVWSVVLPTARSGVVTGILLGVARIVGETAPLIYTEFGSQLINANPLNHPQESLPFFIFTNVREAEPVLITIAFQAAFVLMMIVLVLFAAARILGRTRGKKSSRLIGSEDDTMARMFVPVPMQRSSSPGQEGGGYR